jgi:DNA-binding GntR family transcriptional regulator
MTSLTQRPAFAPVERDTMQERVYLELRQALMRGHFRPGEVLIVRTLSDQFGTSHMPVRDALSRLVAEQALEVLPSRSVAVPVLSRERCEDVQETREMLEGRAAALAATRISEEEIADLRALDSDMHAALARRDVETFVGTNWRFHFTLYAASRRTIMLRMIESLWLQIGPPLRGCIDDIMRAPEIDTEFAVTHHDEMIEALERRDPEGVRQAIAGDLRGLTDYLLKVLPEVPPGPRPRHPSPSERDR